MLPQCNRDPQGGEVRGQHTHANRSTVDGTAPHAGQSHYREQDNGQ
ncbi:Uncharacterised protein [Mycobacterium tuberculosis]|nr:Uncharacterised protein [Mycobacterium tuberculosis]